MVKLKQLDGPVLETDDWQVAAEPPDADLCAPAPRRVGPIHGAVTGTLTAWDRAGNPLVVFRGSGAAGVPAQSTVALDRSHTGRRVVLVFEDGVLDAPIILGLVGDAGGSAASIPAPGAISGRSADVDGTSLILTAEREVVLRCGDASITLTRAGKVIIRGTYVVSRSSGVNRIKGGVVHIN